MDDKEAIEIVGRIIGGHLSKEQWDANPDEAHDLTLLAKEVIAAYRASLKSSGYRIVPEEATLEMLDCGHRAYMRTQRSGVSGMTIESQTRAECAREAVCWRAMIAASEEVE